MARRKPPEPQPAPTIYTVYLDAEAFGIIRESLTAKLKYSYAPRYLEVVKRAVESFNDADRAVNGEPPPPRRTVPRKVAKSRRSR